MKKIFLLLFLIPLISCSLFINENDGYEKALENWQAEKVSDYEFQFNKGCFCPSIGTVLIEVRADTVYQVLTTDTRETLFVQLNDQTQVPALEYMPDYFKTISELFDVIRDARSQKANKIVADYDSELGYPKSIDIDYVKDAVDDEVAYLVSNYKELGELLSGSN
jgi:hypothetical protein